MDTSLLGRCTWALLILPIVFLSGCATFFTQPKSNPESPSSVTAGWPVERLLRFACEPGKSVTQASGTVWLKTQSKQVQGQFNASVFVRRGQDGSALPGSVSLPAELKLDVTNFLGGTVAWVTIHQGHYEITKGPSEPVTTAGVDSWAGIPLRWASDLFLGSIPCPALSDRLILKKEEAGQLTVEAPEDPLGAQIFSFKYRKIEEGLAGGTLLWPESLHWERLTTPKNTVDFKFDRPEKITLSPLQWEASSSQGAIKVRWRERQRQATSD